MTDESNDCMDAVVVPINGVLDLHTFNPRDLKELMRDYIEACREKELFELRIVHGKGSGVLRARVRSLLEKHADVQHYEDAPLQAGGWGATLVTLKKEKR